MISHLPRLSSSSPLERKAELSVRFTLSRWESVMSFYLVRTKSKRNLVGLFFAESLPHLVVDISKVADTEDCEYIELPGGGIYWKFGETRIPLKEGGSLPWERSEMTSHWTEALYARDALWLSLLTTEDVAR
jgi:hypothetical protein